MKSYIKTDGSVIYIEIEKDGEHSFATYSKDGIALLESSPITREEVAKVVLAAVNRDYDPEEFDEVAEAFIIMNPELFKERSTKVSSLDLEDCDIVTVLCELDFSGKGFTEKPIKLSAPIEFFAFDEEDVYYGDLKEDFPKLVLLSFAEVEGVFEVTEETPKTKETPSEESEDTEAKPKKKAATVKAPKAPKVNSGEKKKKEDENPYAVLNGCHRDGTPFTPFEASKLVENDLHVSKLLFTKYAERVVKEVSSIMKNCPGQALTLHLFGESGAGKSELAKIIASKLGLPLIGTQTFDGSTTAKNAFYEITSVGEPVVKEPKYLTLAMRYGGVVIIDEAAEADTAVAKGILNPICDGTRTYVDVDGELHPIHQDFLLILTSNTGDENCITVNELDSSTVNRLRSYNVPKMTRTEMVKSVIKNTGFDNQKAIGNLIDLVLKRNKGSSNSSVADVLANNGIRQSLSLRNITETVKNYMYVYSKDTDCVNPWLESCRSAFIDGVTANQDEAIRHTIEQIIIGTNING